MSDDNRPRCEHLVVYPMENCATCMKSEIAELKAKLAEQKEGLELQARLILAGVRKEYELQLEVAKLKAGCNS